MTAQASAGRIDTRDIDELEQVVQPWDVVLRQTSPGKLHASMDYVQVNGIVLYRERWSHRIVATGATPPGFFFFGGPTLSGPGLGWCGTDLGTECLAFGRAASEVDFVTQDAEEHICVLVPEQLMRRYLGEEFLTLGLLSARYLACQRRCGEHLLQMMERVLDKYLVHRDLLANERTCQAIEWQLMGGLLEFLLTRDTQSSSACHPGTARYAVVRRAIEFCDATRQPISVSDLAAASGVSTRVLEMGFRETVRTSPGRFIRLNRMNQVRKELLASDRGATSVTGVLGNWGLTELGRFAVEYKNLFGESPSATLRRDIVAPARRLAHALLER